MVTTPAPAPAANTPATAEKPASTPAANTPASTTPPPVETQADIAAKEKAEKEKKEKESQGTGMPFLDMILNFIKMLTGNDDKDKNKEEPTLDVALNAPAAGVPRAAPPHGVGQDMAITPATTFTQSVSSLDPKVLASAQAAVAPVTNASLTTTQSANNAASINKPSLVLGG